MFVVVEEEEDGCWWVFLSAPLYTSLHTTPPTHSNSARHQHSLSGYFGVFHRLLIRRLRDLNTLHGTDHPALDQLARDVADSVCPSQHTYVHAQLLLQALGARPWGGRFRRLSQALEAHAAAKHGVVVWQMYHCFVPVQTHHASHVQAARYGSWGTGCSVKDVMLCRVGHGVWGWWKCMLCTVLGVVHTNPLALHPHTMHTITHHAHRHSQHTHTHTPPIMQVGLPAACSPHLLPDTQCRHNIRPLRPIQPPRSTPPGPHSTPPTAAAAPGWVV